MTIAVQNTSASVAQGNTSFVLPDGTKYSADANGVINIMDISHLKFLPGYVIVGGAAGAQGATGPQGPTGAAGTVKTFFGTAAGTNTYTATISGATPLTAGMIFAITFTNAPTSTSATLNINSTSAVTIKDCTGANIAASTWAAGQTVYLAYNGTNFVMDHT